MDDVGQQNDNEILPTDDEGDHDDELSETTDNIGDLLAQKGESADDTSDDEVYWEATKHRSDRCQLHIVDQHMLVRSLNGNERMLKFYHKSYVWVKPFPKGVTLVFEDCGLTSKIKPAHLPPGDPTREVVSRAQFHILHPEAPDLKIWHQSYVNDSTRADSKEFPAWDEKLAEHDRKHRGKFILGMRRIVEAAGGACGGKR